MIIRSILPTDFRAVRRINDEAFGQPDEGRLVERVRATKGYEPTLELVAEAEGGRLVGHILFSPIAIAGDDGIAYAAIALAPMAVLPGFQRQGIGGKLIRAGLGRVETAGHGAVIVLGHASYYPQFGFSKADRWNIRAPWQVPAEVFMAQELIPGYLVGKAGMVQYPEAFG